LEDNTNCPICDTLLHQSHPLLYISHDRTLQAIVSKLVPNLETDEIERQVEFYEKQKLEFPPQLKERLEQNYLLSQHKKLGLSSSVINGDNGTRSIKSNQHNGDRGADQNYHRNDEQICLSLEPLEDLKVFFSFIIIFFYFSL
jgi:polycomb group RING finger protein 3